MTPAPVLLRRTLPALVVASVIAGVATGSVTARSRPGVDVVRMFTVPVPSVEAPRGGERSPIPLDVFQASERFAGTVAGWLRSPDFVVAVYRRAQLVLPGQPSVRRLGRTIIVVQRGGTIVEARFRARTDEEARTLITAVTEELQSRVDAFNAASATLAFQVVPGDPLIVPALVSPLLRGAVAVVVVFVLGINLVLLRDLFRTPPASPESR